MAEVLPPTNDPRFLEELRRQRTKHEVVDQQPQPQPQGQGMNLTTNPQPQPQPQQPQPQQPQQQQGQGGNQPPPVGGQAGQKINMGSMDGGTGTGANPILRSDNGPGDYLGGTQKGIETHMGGAMGGAAGNPYAVREGMKATEGTGGDPKKIAKNLSTSMESKLGEAGDAVGQAWNYVFGSGGETKIKEEVDPTVAAEQQMASTMQSHKDRMQPVEAQQVSANVDGMQASQAAFAEAIKAQQIQGTTYDPTLAQRTQVGQATTYSGAQVQQDQQNQLREQQINQLQNLSSAPTAAELMSKQQQEEAVKRAMSQAASARGGNIALAQRQAQQIMQEDVQKIAGQAQVNAAQEQLQKQQLAAQIAQQARTGDIDLAKAQAEMTQQAGLQAAELGTKTTLTQAELDQTRELTNAALATDASKWTAQSLFDAAKANQDASLKADIQTALNNVDVSKFNANAQNQMEQFKADAKLRANIANQAADLQAKGMNLDAIAKQMGVEMDALKSLLGASTAVFQTKTAQNTEKGRMDAAKKAGILGGIASGVASVFT